MVVLSFHSIPLAIQAIEMFISLLNQKLGMGLFDKLMFWKKEGSDDVLGAPPIGLEQPTGLDLGPMGGQPGVPGQPPLPPMGDVSGLGTPQQPQAFQDMQQMQPQQPQQADLTSQKLEVISGKLDLIKAGIDNLNQRLEKLEKIAEAGRKGQW